MIRDTNRKTLIAFTLKAFANFSPGLSSGNPGNQGRLVENATLKELRRPLLAKVRNPFRVAKTFPVPSRPRVAKAQPWAEISERFQRKKRIVAFVFRVIRGPIF
jgi:hypothetical protein